MNVYYFGDAAAMPPAARAAAEEFLAQNQIVTLGTNGPDGVHLTVIGMLPGANLDEVYMMGNRRSVKAHNLLADARAELAVTNGVGGLVLCGAVQVLDDEKTKAVKWENWMADYHPQGQGAPDYVLFRLVPQSVRAML